MFCNDGTGLTGTGDWTHSRAGATDVFAPLRKTLLQTALDLALLSRLVAHSSLEKDSPLLDEGEEAQVRHVVS